MNKKIPMIYLHLTWQVLLTKVKKSTFLVETRGHRNRNRGVWAVDSAVGGRNLEPCRDLVRTWCTRWARGWLWPPSPTAGSPPTTPSPTLSTPSSAPTSAPSPSGSPPPSASAPASAQLSPTPSTTPSITSSSSASLSASSTLGSPDFSSELLSSIPSLGSVHFHFHLNFISYFFCSIWPLGLIYLFATRTGFGLEFSICLRMSESLSTVFSYDITWDFCFVQFGLFGLFCIFLMAIRFDVEFLIWVLFNFWLQWLEAYWTKMWWLKFVPFL